MEEGIIGLLFRFSLGVVAATKDGRVTACYNGCDTLGENTISENCGRDNGDLLVSFVASEHWTEAAVADPAVIVVESAVAEPRS